MITIIRLIMQLKNIGYHSRSKKTKTKTKKTKTKENKKNKNKNKTKKKNQAFISPATLAWGKFLSLPCVSEK